MGKDVILHGKLSLRFHVYKMLPTELLLLCVCDLVYLTITLITIIRPNSGKYIVLENNRSGYFNNHIFNLSSVSKIASIFCCISHIKV